MNIIFNGKKVNTDKKYAHELGEGNIIVNGYEVRVPYILKENDNIIIYKKGEIPGKEMFAIMAGARNNIDPNVLLNSKVVICGLGGLGSNISLMLARAGVGELCLIDFDTVDITNINRQVYFIKHIGMLKTDAITEIIREINPYINIKTINIKIDENNIKGLFDRYPSPRLFATQKSTGVGGSPRAPEKSALFQQALDGVTLNPPNPWVGGCPRVP